MDLSRYALLDEEDQLVDDAEEIAVRVSPKAMAAAAPPPAVTEPVVAPPVAPKPIRTVADKYGVEMDDALPPTRVAKNENALASGLLRAGSQLAAAVGGGRPDYAAADALDKQGMADAGLKNEREDKLVDFKRQLLAKVLSDRAAKADAGQNMDPTSEEYRATVALNKSDPASARRWDEYERNSMNEGVKPNPYEFAKAYKLGQAAGQTNTKEGQVYGFGQRKGMQEDSQEHAEKMEGIRFSNALVKLGVQEGYKLDAEARHANVYERPKLQGATPTAEHAKLVMVSDARKNRVSEGLQKLMDFMTANPDALSKMNPLDGERSELGVLYGNVRDAYRVAADFGVPSGNDMKMIDDVVKDPRRFLNIFTGRDTEGFRKLQEIVNSESDSYAKTFGYGPRSGAPMAGAPSAQPQDPRTVLKNAWKQGKSAVEAVVGGSPTPAPTAAPPLSGAAVQEPASPSASAEVERKDPKTGKVAIFDAATKKFLRWK
jgi:hypothetical protein